MHALSPRHVPDLSLAVLQQKLPVLIKVHSLNAIYATTAGHQLQKVYSYDIQVSLSMHALVLLLQFWAQWTSECPVLLWNVMQHMK